MSGPSQATQLVDLALAARAHFFRSPEGDAYAGFPVSEHYETWPVRSRGFRLWLTAQFYALTKKTPNAQALTDALGALEGRAWFEGSCEPVFMRLAERDGVLYLDLGDSAWRTVAITPSGWEMRDAVPVRFRRTRGMLPLPAPERGGRLDGLRDFLNVDD